MRLPWSKKKYATKAFIEIKHKKDILRIWIDRNHKPYKVEIRFDEMVWGYMDVDKFMKNFREHFVVGTT